MRSAFRALALLLMPFASSRAAEPPQLAEVQSAYDAAQQEARDKHVVGLKILGVKCNPASSGRYSCEVGFSVPEDTEGRVYLDVASLERVDERWRLFSGLCRR